jgi:predicted O-methyltransferase YrrM
MYPFILQKFDNYLVKLVNRYANRKWYNNPLKSGTDVSVQEYQQLWKTAKEKTWPIVDAFEKQSAYAIDTEWFHNLALPTQVVKKKSEVCYQHGRLLYSAVRMLIADNNHKNLNILESGTARGFSSLCMAKAIDDSHINGKIISFDVLPHQTKMYWNCVADHEGKKTRAELLNNYSGFCEQYIIFHQGNTMTEASKTQMQRIHFAFLDAGHDYYHVMGEFDVIKNYQQKGDIIFFDDYTQSQFPGVVKAVDEICSSYAYQKEIIELSENRAYVLATKL